MGLAISTHRYHNSVLADIYLKTVLCVFNNKRQIDMAGKAKGLVPSLPPCTDISTAIDNKIWFSCRLFWCDAIVVWTNSRGLYKGKHGHLKCHTAAVAEAQEFPFSRGCVSLPPSLWTLAPHVRHRRWYQMQLTISVFANMKYLLSLSNPCCRPVFLLLSFFSLCWKMSSKSD